jgi:hypothetical protein
MIAYKETSREAWDSIEGEISGALDLDILSTIAAHEPDGIICQAIEEELNRLHQAVSGNLRHLVEKGYVQESGRYGQTRSGRKAILWVLARPAPPPDPPLGQLELF